jgi:DNA-directed RNA polymerase specialized sigma24 family protein
VDPQEELVRLKVLELRRQMDSQAEAIIELSRAGFAPSRIAGLLGTTPNTVNVALQRAKVKTSKKRKG